MPRFDEYLVRDKPQGRSVLIPLAYLHPRTCREYKTPSLLDGRLREATGAVQRELSAYIYPLENIFSDSPHGT